MIEIDCDFGDFEQEIPDVTMDNFQKIGEAAIRLEELDCDFEISLSFVGDSEIQSLNKEYRGIDRKTDVLSFPMYERWEIDESCEGSLMPLTLGDVIISVPTAMEQAEEFNHSLNRELAFLFCHSIFHLLGYDHIDEADSKIMEEKQSLVLNELGISRAD